MLTTNFRTMIMVSVPQPTVPKVTRTTGRSKQRDQCSSLKRVLIRSRLFSPAFSQQTFGALVVCLRHVLFPRVHIRIGHEDGQTDLDFVKVRTALRFSCFEQADRVCVELATEQIGMMTSVALALLVSSRFVDACCCLCWY